MFKVLLTDNCAPEALSVFDRYQDIEVKRTGTLPKEELVRIIPEYHAIIVRSPTKLSADVIAAARNLKFIGRAGVGVDNIDLEEATRRGIVVMNSPGGNTISTAEHTVALMLSIARKIPHAHNSLVLGEWDRAKFKGVELYGKTLGIVGLGRVGREVAKRLLSFGMRVIASDPYADEASASALGVELVDLGSLLKESDFITIHAPLDNSTRALISHEEFQLMRQGVFLVNCARGGIVDEDALQKALESGRVAGAAMDVYSKEPPERMGIFEHQGSVFTPHIGAATDEAQVRVAVDVTEAVAEALVNGTVRNVVNRVDR